MGFTAQATTGTDGGRLSYGFDKSNIFVDGMGERMRTLEREVSYVGTTTLRDALTNNKYIRFNLLVNILKNQEKVPVATEVELYASGNIQEIRIKKKCYRIKGNKYYGLVK